MAVRDVTVGFGADLSDLRREVATGYRVVRDFGRNVLRSIPSRIPAPKIDTTGLAAQGAAAGRAFMSGMNSQLKPIQGGGASDPFAPLSRSAREAGAAIAAAFAVREVIQMSDAWVSAGNRLALVTANAQEQARVQRQLFDLAQGTRAEYQATVSLYTKIDRASEQIGVTQQEVARITETVNKAFAVSGASAKEAAAGVHQLGQALASGLLRGDEFNTISEAAPRLRDSIAEAAGVSIGELRKMAEAGELTAGLVGQAILKSGDTIDSEFDRMQMTIGQSLQQLQNSAVKFIGTQGELTGASVGLANAISLVAMNFDLAATAGLGFVAVMGARTIGRMGTQAIQSTQQAVTGYRQQQAELVKIASQEAATANAAKSAAAQKVAATETEINALKRLEAQTAAHIVMERRRLGEVAQVAARQASVPISTLTPLGGKAIEAELRARAAAQKSLEASTRSLNQAEAALIATEQRRIASEAALTAAQIEETAATVAATAADRAQATAIATTTTRATAGALAMRGLGVVVGGLGGPIGIGILAITGLVLWLAKSRAEADAAARAIDEYKTRVQSLPAIKFQEEQSNVKTQLDEALAIGRNLRAELAALPQMTAGMNADELARIRQRNAAITRGLTDNEAQVRQLQGQMRALGEIEDDNLQRLGNNVVAADAAVEAEAGRLAKLRDLGVASTTELKRISEIVTRDRARVAELLALPESDQTDKLRQERIELQQRLNMLTRETTNEKALRADLKLEDREAREALAKFIRDADDSVVRYRIATEQGESDEVRMELMDQIILRERELTDEIERRGGIRQADTSLLKKQQELLDALRLPAIEFKGPPPIIPLRPVLVPGSLPALIEEIKRTEAMVEVAQVFGNRGAETAAQADRNQAIRYMVGQLQIGGASAEVIQKSLEGAGVSAEDVAKAFGRMESFSLEGIAAGIRGALRIADAFGEVNEEIRMAIEGVADIATGAQEIQRAMSMEGGAFGSASATLATITGAVAMLGGLGSLVQSFTADPEWVAEHREIVKQNNEELRKVADALAGFRNTLGDMREAEAKLVTLFARSYDSVLGAPDNFFEQLSEKFGGFFDSDAPLKFLESELKSLGLTVQQLNRIAEANNIQLLDESGNPIPEALRQLNEMLGMTREILMRWGETLEDQTSRIAAYNDVFEIEDTPIRRFQDQLNLLGEFSPDIARFFEGIDVSTEVGQREAEALLRRLFTEASSQTDNVIRDMLGASEFESLSDFIDTILDMDGALDDLREKTEEAVAEMINVPAGFKVTLARIEAMNPMVQAPDIDIEVPPVTTELDELYGRLRRRVPDIDEALAVLNENIRRRSEEMGAGGRSRPGTVAASASTATYTRSTESYGDTYNFEKESVVIQAAPGDSGEDLLEKFNNALWSKARQRKGNNAVITDGLG